MRTTPKPQRQARHRVGSSDQKATYLDRRFEALADLDRHAARSPCHMAAYSPGPYQPGVSSPSAPAPAQASPSSTSRLSCRTRTSDPIEPSARSCRLTCVKQQSWSVPTACAQRRHDLSRQQTARRLEAQVAIGADSTAVRCAGVLLAMSKHTWVGATSVNLAFPAERESARTSNALAHRTTSGRRRRRVSETPARPGEAADGDSAGAVFQSVHMHRQVVAFSTLAIEQTPAALGFAQNERRFDAGGVAAPSAEAATISRSKFRPLLSDRGSHVLRSFRRAAR